MPGTISGPSGNKSDFDIQVGNVDDEHIFSIQMVISAVEEKKQ